MPAVLWTEKYRPRKLDDYIFQDPQVRAQVEKWIDDGVTDNILMTGPAGTGKTSLAGILMAEMKIDESDILRINASREGNVETMREMVYGFVSSGGWNGMKYVLLDEADGITAAGQFSLKDAMEQHSGSARFILTANVKGKIIPPLQDRCIGLDIHRPDMDQYQARMVQILDAEGVDITGEESLDALDTIIRAHYPSLRGCIRNLQRYSTTGRLELPAGGAEGSEWKFKMVELFKAGRIREARELVCKAATKDEIAETYRWLHENSKIFGSHQEEAILVIAKYYYQNSFVADPEICLSACMVELARMDQP
jgi:DNA polymerase III delta prime subunit